MLHCQFQVLHENNLICIIRSPSWYKKNFLVATLEINLSKLITSLEQIDSVDFADDKWGPMFIYYASFVHNHDTYMYMHYLGTMFIMPIYMYILSDPKYDYIQVHVHQSTCTWNACIILYIILTKMNTRKEKIMQNTYTHQQKYQ